LPVAVVVRQTIADIESLDKRCTREESFGVVLERGRLFAPRHDDLASRFSLGCLAYDLSQGQDRVDFENDMAMAVVNGVRVDR
jgi:hypothetical protein